MDAASLQAENRLLGAMVEDLRARCAKADGPPPPPPPPAAAVPVDTASLQAENRLLGAIVEDLRARCATGDGPSPSPTPADAAAAAAAAAPAPPPLRQTEDALLDMHQECKVARQALRRQTDVLQRTQALLSPDS